MHQIWAYLVGNFMRIPKITFFYLRPLLFELETKNLTVPTLAIITSMALGGFTVKVASFPDRICLIRSLLTSLQSINSQMHQVLEIEGGIYAPPRRDPYFESPGW